MRFFKGTKVRHRELHTTGVVVCEEGVPTSEGYMTVLVMWNDGQTLRYENVDTIFLDIIDTPLERMKRIANDK